MSADRLGTPLIVTAQLPREIFLWANRLREEFYPAHRDRVPAHVTLFRTLPPSAEQEIRIDLAAMARQASSVAGRDGVSATISRAKARSESLFLLVDSPRLDDVRADLAERFYGLLPAQDQHRAELHITLCNGLKVKETKALEQNFNADFPIRQFRFEGLALHRYRAGHWESLALFRFR